MTTPSPAGAANAKPKRRFFSWLGFWSRREAPPLNIVDSVTFRTPSLGEAFGFSVVVRCCWCATGGRNRDDMNKAIAERRPQDVRHIRRIVREAVRDLHPWQAATAEERANRSLSEQREGVLAREWYEYDISTTCSAWVEIDVADSVRAYQQKEMRARLGWAAHSYASERALESMNDLRGKWLTFLGGDPARAENDWRSPFATQLAESGANVTGTVASMHWRRRRDVAFATAFYSDVIKDLRDAGSYDTAIAVEDTLEKMVTAYGLPRIDLVGEMLRDELMPPGEDAPMSHVFGTGADDEGSAVPVTDLFGSRSGQVTDEGGSSGMPRGGDEPEEPEDGEPETATEQEQPDAPVDGEPEPADEEQPSAEVETGDEE
jgi:hypothetical protein